MVFFLLAIGAFWWRDNRPDCTIQLAGTDANIEFKGWGSGAICQKWVNAKNLADWYETTPSGTLMCTVARDGQTATVRDSGIFKFMGGEICAQLQAGVGA